MLNKFVNLSREVLGSFATQPREAYLFATRSLQPRCSPHSSLDERGGGAAQNFFILNTAPAHRRSLPSGGGGGGGGGSVSFVVEEELPNNHPAVV